MTAPRRAAEGVGLQRLLLLLAVLQRRLRYPVSSREVYVNVVGGLSLKVSAMSNIHTVFSKASLLSVCSLGAAMATSTMLVVCLYGYRIALQCLCVRELVQCSFGRWIIQAVLSHMHAYTCLLMYCRKQQVT
jgi:hypothetical protein